MHALQIIVETPKGSQFKYKYDSKKEWFEVSKSLPTGLAFPYDFGAIPGTKGQDGDPLDVLILTEFSFLQGSRIRCNVIGALKAEQSTGDETVRNDRIFVTPELDGLHPVYESLSDLQNEKLKEIENFFVYYNAMQKKEFKPLGILSAKETWKLIKQQRS
jgi:inorganic pyrophosphatase